MPRSVRVAVAQLEVRASPDETLAATREAARDAAAQGASLLVLPETWVPGYPVWLDVCRDAGLWDHPPVKRLHARMAADAVVAGGETERALAALAREHGLTIVVGVVERVDEGAGRGTLYNAILTIDPAGEVRNRHRKLVPTYTERLVWGPGDGAGLRSVETPAGRVGALVCWEHWMPLARQAMHEAGEDVHVALWPTAHELHQVASRHYAFEGRCFVLAAGAVMRAALLPAELEAHPERVRSPDDLVMRGGSAVIGPDGRYLAGPVYDAPALLVADLDLDRVREERMTLDVTGHYARPDVLGLTVRRERR
jgi:predicted amidohydrolase